MRFCTTRACVTSSTCYTNIFVETLKIIKLHTTRTFTFYLKGSLNKFCLISPSHCPSYETHFNANQDLETISGQCKNDFDIDISPYITSQNDSITVQEKIGVSIFLPFIRERQLMVVNRKTNNTLGVEYSVVYKVWTFLVQANGQHPAVEFNYRKK